MARSLLPAALFLALTLPAGAGWWSSGEKSPEDVKQERIKERARSEKLCAKHREFFAKWRAPEIDGDKHYAACFFDYIQNDLYRFDQASWDGLQPVDRCSKLGGARLGDEKKRAHGADRVEDDEKAYVSFEDIREVIQEHCTAWLNARRKLRPEKRSVARREVAGDKIKVADRKDVVAEVTWDGIEAAKRELAGLSGAYIFGRNGATIETLEREIAAAEQKLRSAKGLERAAAMAEQGSLKDAKAAQAAPVEIRTGDEAAGAARSGAMFTGEKSRPGQDPAAKSAPGVPGKAAVGDNTAEPALLSAGAPKTIYEKDLERRVPGLAEGKDRKGLEKLQQKGHDAVFQTKDLPHTDLKQDAALALYESADVYREADVPFKINSLTSGVHGAGCCDRKGKEHAACQAGCCGGAKSYDSCRKASRSQHYHDNAFDLQTRHPNGKHLNAAELLDLSSRIQMRLDDKYGVGRYLAYPEGDHIHVQYNP